MDIERQLQELEGRTLHAIGGASDEGALDEVRRSVLGKKGELTGLLRGLGALAPADRPRVGALVNQSRDRLEAAVAQREQVLASAALDAALQKETLDVSLPAPTLSLGRRHPIMATWDDIVRIFAQMGYAVADGPEVETEYYNFDALNIGPDHPARDERDSLFVGSNLVMRTETSAVQIRTMEGREPPIQIIAPGRVYRRDAVDRTHSAIFHQVEGLYVDEGVSFSHLKGTLSVFLQQLFDEAPGSGNGGRGNGGRGSDGLQTRFRPHFFPFTEPSAEFDVWFNGRWLELGGCGMVHPKVLENVGYDPERYTGFAFGFGIERMAMIKFNIDDLRLFYDNDWRFLSQF
jgi:phenylalanyl-tRNA synthetase alpha chain